MLIKFVKAFNLKKLIFCLKKIKKLINTFKNNFIELIK